MFHATGKNRPHSYLANVGITPKRNITNIEELNRKLPISRLLILEEEEGYNDKTDTKYEKRGYSKLFYEDPLIQKLAPNITHVRIKTLDDYLDCVHRFLKIFDILDHVCSQVTIDLTGFPQDAKDALRDSVGLFLGRRTNKSEFEPSKFILIRNPSSLKKIVIEDFAKIAQDCGKGYRLVSAGQKLDRTWFSNQNDVHYYALQASLVLASQQEGKKGGTIDSRKYFTRKEFEHQLTQITPLTVRDGETKNLGSSSQVNQTKIKNRWPTMLRSSFCDLWEKGLIESDTTSGNTFSMSIQGFAISDHFFRSHSDDSDLLGFI